MFQPKNNNGRPEIAPEELKGLSEKVRIVDVRRPEEFVGELGHIEGAELVTLGPDLINFLDQGDRNEGIIFVCRSGARSGQATQLSIELGYKKTANMVGGMIRWNELKYSIQK